MATQFTDSYCTIELAKDFAGDAQGVDSNVILKAMIKSASRFVERYTSTYWGPSAYISQEIVSKVIGNFNNVFYTRWAPVLNPTAVVVADDLRPFTNPYINATGDLIAIGSMIGDYVVNGDDGQVVLVGLGPDGLTPLSFSTTPFSVQVSYSVGWGSPNNSPAPNDLAGGISAPDDIQLACAMIAGSWSQYSDRGDIRTRTRQTESVSFLDLPIPTKAALILSSRKRFVS